MNKLVTIFLGAAMIGGCQTNKPHLAECTCPEPDHAEIEKGQAFFSEDREQAPAVRSIFDRQIDNGAAADGMLRAAHFDGDTVNSLGTEKLDAIIRGTAADRPIIVHLDLPGSGEQAAGEQQAVVAYLLDKGIAEERLEIQTGDNPATRHPATLTASKRYTTEAGVLGSAEVTSDTSSTQTLGGRQSTVPMSPR